MKGMKLKKPDRGNSLEIELGEGQEYLALFSLGSSGYSYQMKE